MDWLHPRHWRRQIVSAAVALCALPAVAGPKAIPFQATLGFTESVTFTFQPPCFAMAQLSGSAEATEIGRVTAVSQDCINPLGAFDPATGSYQFASTGPGVVFTLANGDHVYASYSGTLTYQAGAPHAINGHFIITGGTGRLAGVTGGGTVTGTEDISSVVTGRGQVVFDGSLSLAPACNGRGDRCDPRGR